MKRKLIYIKKELIDMEKGIHADDPDYDRSYSQTRLKNMVRRIQKAKSEKDLNKIFGGNYKQLF